ncbi:hypothetical protein CAP36_14720 [Chitinophagaceae bacterium IBVUCB2]|nr:hypothetical protein CAP36_14720 [Chitinophagaceae bacterium IBVUCB2]
MEKIFTKAEEMADNVKDYINTRIESAKLSVAEKSSKLMANAMAAIIVTAILFFFFLFAGIALSLVLGEWVSNTWAGFLIVAALYLLIGLIVWSCREKIIRLPIMNALIKQFFADDEEN